MKKWIIAKLGLFDLFNRLYLNLSDCDGMCSLCNVDLKYKCKASHIEEKLNIQAIAINRNQ